MYAFIPDASVFAEARSRRVDGAHRDPMLLVDLSVFARPCTDDATALCSEVSSVMSALGIASTGPVRVHEGTTIRGLTVMVPFAEEGTARSVAFFLQAEPPRIVFRLPPLAGIEVSAEQLRDNPSFVADIREAAVRRLLESTPEHPDARPKWSA